MSARRLSRRRFIGLGAGLAGVVGLPRLALAPGRDFKLPLALVVVVVGGAGQIEGALAALAAVPPLAGGFTPHLGLATATLAMSALAWP
ncbi:MAG TPA: hypothetical protein VNL95_02855 [Dehalococcoidia bacterium]|nr:hypothetical protein [Dehalococcoidia bacterium]